MKMNDTYTFSDIKYTRITFFLLGIIITAFLFICLGAFR
jgi:hypothetical protein